VNNYTKSQEKRSEGKNQMKDCRDEMPMQFGLTIFCLFFSLVGYLALILQRELNEKDGNKIKPYKRLFSYH